MSFSMAVSDRRALLATSKPVHQQAVDLAQAKIRADLVAGNRSLFKPAPHRPEPSGNVLDERLAEELDLVVRQLGQLGDVLSDDPILLHRHAAQMQTIDLMQQVLGHLGQVIASSDKSTAVGEISLSGLKARLTRKAL